MSLAREIERLAIKVQDLEFEYERSQRILRCLIITIHDHKNRDRIYEDTRPLIADRLGDISTFDQLWYNLIEARETRNVSKKAKGSAAS